MLPLSKIRQNSIYSSQWLRQLVIGLILIFDSYAGLIHQSGLLVSFGLISGDLRWLLLSFEMFLGSIFLVRLILNNTKTGVKSLLIVTSPIVVVLIGFVILDLVLTGLSRSATINFNLSSIGLSGLYWSAVYLSVAIGLTLTYKVQHFANFAQAEMMLVGSYVALTLMWSDTFYPLATAPKDGIFDWSLLIWASIGAFFITGTIGLLFDRIVYKKLRDKMATSQVMMIASLGVSMVLRAFLFMRFSGASFRFVPDKDWRLTTSTIEVPTERLQLHLGENTDNPLLELVGSVNMYGFAYSKIILVVGIFSALLLLLILLHRTRFGRQMRAVADNADLAASSGINVERVYGSTAFISAGISGIGGALLAAILPINPELGLMLLLPAFAIIVLGSIGSIPGVIIGALIVGALRAISEPILIGAGNALDRPTASGFAEVTPFIFLIGLLLIAPSGIGNAVSNWNIERIRKKRSREISKPNSHGLSSLTSNYSLGSENTSIASVLAEGLFIAKGKMDLAINQFIYLAWKVPLSYLVALSAYLLVPKNYIVQNLQISVPKVHRGIKFSRDSNRGSWIMFFIFLLVLLCVVWLLPSVSSLTKTLQVARIMALVGIFGLAAFSLNLHTGITGMTNFGVIFFVGIGAVTVGLLTAPVETNGYGISPWLATVIAIIIASTAGWFLAYPTARLRMDYFAIVTIALGETLRISLQAEPLLRAGTVTTGIGISNYANPFDDWWNGFPSELTGNLLGLNGPAPYVVLLAIISITCLIGVWLLLSTILSSPWGRILRSIREDELVSQHHGHNILTHKAMSLALGAAIAALAGALWAWLNTNIWPDFMNPVRTTFLIWAAYIVGGRGNNRGMIIGAFLIVIVEFVFNILVVSRGGASLPFHDVTAYLDSIFAWLIQDVGGLIWSAQSIAEVFPRSNVLLSLPSLKLALVGLVIIVALLSSSKGLLPEVPSRPKRTENRHEQATKNGVVDE
jgi:ABC-type branched-subunit amino acid transport system permease subunit